MSTSRGKERGLGTDFDRWLGQLFRKGPFTALIVLVKIAQPRIEPLRSSFVHVVGDELDWGDIVLMLRGAGVNWDGAAFFPTRGDDGGLVPDDVARARLRELEGALHQSRLVLNEGAFFDVWGRNLKVEEAD
ncbi:MAG: hypothetical protein ACTHP8_15945 [Bosea sp. (in: a-proteobacteria)]|uniref:hypothetical protein n=1 Tax=unclassified Bosea (in: a-proteobacteria) TaxID=2653178 RepID=UPI0009682015|nr:MULTISPECIES: hypothetical protein [unclassified Bosea (in: a-proteobacteria)]MBN9456520.1 hypothetical protein [Bosea sp. (in: a-proteobacteria)]OJV08764.1 MAG: hypothetical protein BGO20_21020 [Bosea sp. 67-29]